jgi:hypothetical protein
MDRADRAVATVAEGDGLAGQPAQGPLAAPVWGWRAGHGREVGPFGPRDGPWSTTTRLVKEQVQAEERKACGPRQHGGLAHLLRTGHGRVALPRVQGQ